MHTSDIATNVPMDLILTDNTHEREQFIQGHNQDICSALVAHVNTFCYIIVHPYVVFVVMFVSWSYVIIRHTGTLGNAPLAHTRILCSIGAPT